MKKIKKIYRVLRRYFFFYFRRKEMIRRYMNLTRNKSCAACGCCGAKSHSCKYFDRESRRCIVWGTGKMPLLCKITPFDEKDINDYIRDNCVFFKK